MTPKKSSLAEETADRILGIILEKYQVGSRIPTESALSRELGVGRNTVREAIRALASRNILEVRQGSGTFVSAKQGVGEDPLGLLFLRDRHKVAADIMQIRILLEPAIAALAAQNALPEDVAELERLEKAFAERVERGEDPVAEDAAFHQQIARCSKNAVMPNLIPVISKGIRIFTDLKDGQQVEITLDTHRQIVAAIKTGKAMAAHDAMLLHLAYNRNKLSHISS